jgi:dipeptidyl aminopeptidase/acylaminoacyl peptidase
MPRRLIATLFLASLLAIGADAAERRRFVVDDIARLRDVSDPQISPDGGWVAYVVEFGDVDEDKPTSDIWMTSWDGKRHVQLTASKESDSNPRFSPDGRWLAFLSARGDDDDAPTQVWLLDRSGGEARALTEAEGEVEDFAWSPDSKRLVLAIKDPDPEELAKKKKKGDGQGKDVTPPPIVVSRYLFKADGEGYLGDRRTHLYLFDLESRKTEALTTGTTDEVAPAWSPDGKTLAFVSKRGGDPDRHWNWDVYVIEARAGAEARAVSSFTGPDGAPETGVGPRFSPDGRSLAYLRPLEASFDQAFYGVPALAVAAVAGGEARLLTRDLDRNALAVEWSPDGRQLYFALEDDRSVQLARVPVQGGPIERLTERGRVVKELAVGDDGRLAVVASRAGEPAEVFAFENKALRPLSAQNRGLLADLELATVEELDARSADGTPIGAMLTKPPGFAAGRRYPALLYIHGGPNAQDQHEFDFWAQLFAANGYLVVQPNYRGSTGKGYAFARAIFADWGRLEVQDAIATLDAAISQGLADPQRLGILGWSYGGMMTNYTIASDGRFKAAASGAGISNMITGYGTDQYTVQYENELGLPWKGIDSYSKVSYPFFHADRITTPTLFMCGEKDFNVPLINSEQMYQALRSLGRDTQLVIYPGQYHGIRKPSYQKDRGQRYLDWFEKYLKVDTAAAR